MALHVERVGDVAVLMPRGMLKGGKETDELENSMRKLIYGDQKKILLDLAHVTHMSSMAIGVLAAAHSSATKRQVRFAVCNVEQRIESILVLIKLANILDVRDTRDDGLQALSAP
jgi:anti-anti-sigma factor